ncbi:DUF1501 domain-containing protein [uncultured Rhodoblastus sp.]|uniref:DUF1501 domain-containing protein n=1 Tax=uncultured Rhodoblastus sp. TaxID=543037 RepID=UPI0025F8A851|nr:DUF1501 domain-containing protein [uncultured Rhodoblastus sp.]
MSFSVNRRRLLAGSASLAFAATIPTWASAATRDPRLIVILLRGGLDGLATVAPVGDPDFERQRGGLALKISGDRPALPLDSLFALNPAMPTFKTLYDAKQALFVQAVCIPYRDRSHFDGQDVLESGQPAPGRVNDGWLNRFLASLPGRGDRASGEGLSIAPTTPLIMRGAAPVLGWWPQNIGPASDDLVNRLMDLYGQRDAALQKALAESLRVEALARMGGRNGDRQVKGAAALPPAMRQMVQGAWRLMRQPEGPRIAAMYFDGWDTHANEGPSGGRLAQLLGGLDGALDELRAGLGDIWDSTVVVMITEFGRTVRINGTAGADHGVGTVALLAGGAVKGGRGIYDWPGLADSKLYQNRDLAPTTDLRAVLKGILAEHFEAPAGLLGTTIFPDSAAVKPIAGLVA